jgi:hypothetical protein
MFDALANTCDRHTFSVDAVTPAESHIPTEPLCDHVAKRLGRKLVFIPERDEPVIKTLNYVIGFLRQNPDAAMTTVDICHPLIDAVGRAFSQHRPLTLFPIAYGWSFSKVSLITQRNTARLCVIALSGTAARKNSGQR